ncbi:MAG TPA: hypothetical protein VMQ17_28640 [Candidatus Sulfotelmatobacter sp.]|jgi:Zn finger protein HypA/HybF involved in hydrogenase expression|nr:hypothetical protein [Candidatus Sulfotelmatobacter sp.]
MHELSIAMGILDAALDEAQRHSVQVSAVHLRLGAPRRRGSRLIVSKTFLSLSFVLNASSGGR